MNRGSDRGGLDLTQGSIFRNLIRLSLPIMLSNFIQTLYNLTDTFWLGKLGGQAKAAVSVTGLSFPLIFFILSFGFGFVVAGTALVARYRGGGQWERMREISGQLVVLVLIFAVFVSLVVVFGLEFILRLMQTPAEIHDMAADYLRVVLFGMTMMSGFMVFQGMSQGLGDTFTPMSILLFSVALNLVLDPLMIFGMWFFPAWGVLGAGWATLISRTVALLLAIWFFRNRYPTLFPSMKQLVPDRAVLWRILKIAVPASLSQSATSLGFMLLMGFVNTFGTVVISVYSIGNRMIGLFMMPAMGVSNGLAAIVGQNLGARRLDRVLSSIRVAWLVVIVIMFTGCSLMFLFGAELTRFFIDDPQIMAIGQRMFRVTAFAAFTFGNLFVFFGVFNGSGHTFPVMMINIVRLWLIRIPFTFILSGRLAELLQRHFDWKLPWLNRLAILEYPYDALWYAMLLSNFISIGIATGFYFQGKWKRKKLS